MAAVDSGVRLANAAKSGDLSNVNAADALNVAKVKLLSMMHGYLHGTHCKRNYSVLGNI